MNDRSKLKDRARDELFSHINRCGVLQAAEEDQKHWMDETMEYLGERYPDLTETALRELYTLGMRFCRPAIPHGRPGGSAAEEGEEQQASGNGQAPENGQAPSETPGETPGVEAQGAEHQGEAVGAGAGDTAVV